MTKCIIVSTDGKKLIEALISNEMIRYSKTEVIGQLILKLIKEINK